MAGSYVMGGIVGAGVNYGVDKLLDRLGENVINP